MPTAVQCPYRLYLCQYFANLLAQAPPPAFMKQQGFHVAEKQQGFHVPEGAPWRAKQQQSGALPSSSVASASSRLADGLQGLMDMCNAGSLTTSAVNASVGLPPLARIATQHHAAPQLWRTGCVWGSQRLRGSPAAARVPSSFFSRLIHGVQGLMEVCNAEHHCCN